MDGSGDATHMSGLSATVPCPAMAGAACVSCRARSCMGAAQADIHRHVSNKAIKDKRMTKRVPGFLAWRGNPVGA